MARYQITTPDGKRTFEVDGPDDATPEELQAFARQQAGVGANYPVDASGVKQRQQPDPETSLVQDVGTGIGEIVQGAGEGAANVLDHAAGWLTSGLDAAGNFIGAGNIGQGLLDAGKKFGLSGDNNLQSAFSPPVEGLDTLRGIGRFAGETVATAPLAGFGHGLRAAGLAGAASGALLSDGRDLGSVAADAGIGAVGGATGAAALRGIAQIAEPVLDEGVRSLIRAGVPLTPGQVVAGRGAGGRAVKKVEDTLATLPLVGGAVAGAQRRAVEGLNRGATQRALTPIGERLPADVQVGHNAIAYAGDRLRAAYKDVLPRLSGGLDTAFETRVNAIRQRANLPEQYNTLLDQAQAELGNAFTRAGPDGAYNGRTLRDASERLTDLAAGWRRSDDPYVRMVGDVADRYREQLHALARRQNPGDATRLRDIDRGYASLVRVEKAALNSDDGVFSPAAYKNATRSADRSTRRRATARGQALDQDLSSAASSIMSNTAGQGGSKDVNSLAVLGALGVGAVGGQPAALGAIGGGAVGSLLYTQPGTAAFRNAFARENNLAPNVAQLLRYGARAAPVAAPAAIDQVR